MVNPEEIRRVGNLFRGRLPDCILDLALSYIDAGEVPLAVDTLWEILMDHNVAITKSEYDKLLYLAKEFGGTFFVPTSNQLAYMEKLVK